MSERDALAKSDVAGVVERLRSRRKTLNEGYGPYDIPDPEEEAAATILALGARVKELEEENDRLTGKLCLICGATEPCELDKSEMSPCTFDPHPIAAARGFLERATALEAQLKRAEEVVKAAQDSARFLWVENDEPGRTFARLHRALAAYTAKPEDVG